MTDFPTKGPRDIDFTEVRLNFGFAASVSFVFSRCFRSTSCRCLLRR